jgi:hypothetical protein
MVTKPCFGQIAGFMDRGLLILHPKFLPWYLKGKLTGGQFLKPSLVMLGSLISKGLSPWVSFLSSLAFGIYSEKYACSLELRIPIF